ncbi:hypothetical protein GGQ74_001179 [Desulfobaculum xiamenense]|uniref:Uncharacterized protein n=1 Tax=Desulfobaculum xiamenense TaxID=995050 RepID=A0A846QSA0_9BACT|nr:hypothetical protein [Desulfobaculum xiamenense]
MPDSPKASPAAHLEKNDLFFKTSPYLPHWPTCPKDGDLLLNARMDRERKSHLKVHSMATNYNRIYDAIVKLTSDIPCAPAAWILRTTPKFPVTP